MIVSCPSPGPEERDSMMITPRGCDVRKEMEEEEEEEEESLLTAHAVNEEDSERDRATQV